MWCIDIVDIQRLISKLLGAEDKIMLDIALNMRTKEMDVGGMCGVALKYMKAEEVDVNVKVWEGEKIYGGVHVAGADERAVEVHLRSVLEGVDVPYYLELLVKNAKQDAQWVWSQVERGMRDKYKLRRIVERSRRDRQRRHVLKMLVMPESHYKIVSNKISIKAKKRQLMRRFHSNRYVQHVLLNTHKEVRTLEYDTRWES